MTGDFITKDFNYINTHLKNIYKVTRHLFRNVEMNKFMIDNRTSYKGCQSDIINEVQLEQYFDKISRDKEKIFSYSIRHRTKIIENKIYCSIPGHILCGLYFPNHKVGDKIEFCNNKIKSLEITDTNKIYLPFNNTHFAFIHPMASPITVKSKVPIYTIHIRQYRTNGIYTYYEDDGTIKTLDDGVTKWTTDGKIRDGYIYNYVEEASAEIIQNAWRNYKRRSIFNLWKKDINNINHEIEYMPDFGVKYYEAFNNFTKLISV